MNLYYGSSGDHVRQLQSALNRFGYGLDVDGGFGPKTLAAVRDYQTQNHLRVDGVVGSETWGSLTNQTPAAAAPSAPKTSAAVLSGVSQETLDKLTGLEQGYVPSAEVSAARAQWDSVSDREPGSYTSPYSGEKQRLYQQINGRKPFSYDPGKDPVFQQYTNSYVRQGQAAMTDTLGKAAALTGGHTSSYGQTAGQQSYQSYLQKLYDLLPQLASNAQSRYDSEGKDLYSQYYLLKSRDAQSYDRWRDTVSAWKEEASEAYEAYKNVGAEDADAAAVLRRQSGLGAKGGAGGHSEQQRRGGGAGGRGAELRGLRQSEQRHEPLSQGGRL